MKFHQYIFPVYACLLLCFSTLLSSQPVIVWDKVYGSSHDDSGIQLVGTPDGGCIFIAWPLRPGNGDIPEKKGERDVWACKLDAAGKIVYSRILGGSNEDFAASVIRTDDGGAIFQYGTLSTDFDIPYTIGKNDEIFHKLDAVGKTEWVKVFGCSEGDSGLALQKGDGNFLMYVVRVQNRRWIWLNWKMAVSSFWEKYWAMGKMGM